MLQQVTGVRVQAPSTEEIPGWLYIIIPGEQGKTQPAMPEKCPRCDADFRRRETFKSPLRNHRTGFQKATQVLADALFREMAAEAAESRKLMIFSDSRQDAAKLAGGIGRDHFRDTVRLAFIRAFRRFWPGLVAFLRQMFASNLQSLPLQQALNQNQKLHTAVTTPANAEGAVRAREFQSALPPELHAEAWMWLSNAPSVNPQARKEWLVLLQSYPSRIPLRHLRGVVRDEFLRLGMCPGGPVWKALWYRPGGSEAQGRQPWFTCYDWSQDLPVPLVSSTEAQRSHLERIANLLMGELMYALFPHMARTLEGLAQGWVSYRPYASPTPQVIAATEAVIRQLGVRRMHPYADRFWAGAEDQLRRFSARYIDNCGITPVEVQQQLLESRAGIPSANGLALAPDNLMLVPPPNDQEQISFRCPRCNAFYLHDVGICPECPDPTTLVRSAAAPDFDYYVELTEHERATFFRINCEELTGQTDSIDRPRRQRWFQEIFIGDEIKKIRGIDLLSVTTTMEAGVDIGALNAVMMANMPPRRFNYQQRVGRAGRRAGGVSLAVTFCRGRSHDDFYFQRPENIAGDPTPAPYVDMRSKEIFKRVLIKEVLRVAFTDVLGQIGGDGGDNVHGEFGLAADWPRYELNIQQWFQCPKNVQAFMAMMETLTVETPWHGADGSAFRNEMLWFLQHDLVPRIREIAASPAYTQEALSERLANAGLLPMFGFPTRVRVLFAFWPRQARQWPPETGTVDRNLNIAISQFAPGSQTVKDKAVHTAAGVVSFRPTPGGVLVENGFNPPLPDQNPHPIGLCENCQAVIPFEGPMSEPQTCEVCGETSLRVLDAREPKGFFTNLEPEDFEGQFEWTPRSTRPSMSISGSPFESEALVGNAMVASLKDNILSINDNAGAGGFCFRPAQVYGESKDGAYAVEEAQGERAYISTGGPTYQIVLLARRLTDILLIGIENWPEGVFADPTTVEGRAAWYSFAFWLRLAAGAYLDVDALELQAGFRSLSRNGQAIGQAFLCDQLENGAGYCRELARLKRFRVLLEQANPTHDSITAQWIAAVHAAECDTSCNHCLRDFHNLPYHGLLDWRLALDMARAASLTTSMVDLDSPWGGLGNPWANLVEGTNAPVPNTLARLGYAAPTRFGTLRGYVHQGRPVVLLERHPLWQDSHPVWLATVTEARLRHPAHEIRAINPFRVLRRPADCV
jgi:Distinct helicase family with a unique C-terminal domain including a metal-binding cysteine cluster